MKEKKQRFALVGGASGGIGKAAAVSLAKDGVQILALSRSEDKLKDLCNELNKINGLVNYYLPADYSNTKSLIQNLNAFENEHKILPNIIINNTGGPPGGPAYKASSKEYISAFTQHLIANHTIMQWCVNHLIDNCWGRIINIISTSVKQPLNGLGVSNTVRGAVANWSKTLANELGAFNITVNNILPGATETDRLEQIIQNKMNKSNLDKEVIETQMKSSIPLGRFGKPEELASAIVYLCSEGANYISGTNIVVDGGRTSSL